MKTLSDLRCDKWKDVSEKIINKRRSIGKEYANVGGISCKIKKNNNRNQQ